MCLWAGLKTGRPFADLGADYFEKLDEHRIVRSHVRLELTTFTLATEFKNAVTIEVTNSYNQLESSSVNLGDRTPGTQRQRASDGCRRWRGVRDAHIHPSPAKHT